MFWSFCEGPLVTEAESHSGYAAARFTTLERHLQHFCFSLERGKHVTHGPSHTKERKSSRLKLINKTVAPAVSVWVIANIIVEYLQHVFLDPSAQ